MQMMGLIIWSCEPNFFEKRGMMSTLQTNMGIIKKILGTKMELGLFAGMLRVAGKILKP
jgi:hypothetical protein